MSKPLLGADAAGGSTMHLTDDETVSIVVQGVTRHYRVRVWRDSERPSFVLCVPMPGQPDVDWVASRLFNAVNQTVLGFPLAGMAFCDRSKDGFGTYEFKMFGTKLRKYASQAIRKPVSEAVVRAFIGDIEL